MIDQVVRRGVSLVMRPTGGDDGDGTTEQLHRVLTAATILESDDHDRMRPAAMEAVRLAY